MDRIPTLAGTVAALLLTTACGQPLGGQNTRSAAEPTNTSQPAYTPPVMSSPTVTPTADPSHEADREFVGTLRAHHEEGVAMAIVARERAEHTELGALAGKMITVQQAELLQLQAWLKTPAVASTTTPMDVPGMTEHLQDEMGMPSAASPEVEALKNAKPFDLAFIDAMVPHHLAGVALAKTAVRDTQDAALRTLAESIIRVQGEEIAQLQKWRAAWYPTAASAPGRA